MSLLPLRTWVNQDSQLYATQAQLQNLSTSIGAITISTAQGAGVSVSEATANNFVFSNALSNAGGLSFITIAGSSTLGLSNAGVTSIAVQTGLSTTGSNGAITLSNSGVTSLTAGSNIVLTGTSNVPIINTSLTQSQTALFAGAAATGIVTGANQNSFITYPTLSNSSTINVVPGGLYNIQGVYQFTTTAAGYSIDLIIDNGLNDTQILNNSASDNYAPGGPLNSVPIPFSACVIPVDSTIGMYIGNSVNGAGQSTIVSMNPLYITRIS